MSEPSNSVIVGITGASGAVFAVRLLDVLLRAGRDVHLSISDSGKAVLEQELDVAVDLDRFRLASLISPRNTQSPGALLLAEILGSDAAGPLASDVAVRPAGHCDWGKVHYHHFRQFMAPIASGSFLSGGMVICPCSGTTLSAIAHAAAGNLIQRAAEVQLKERRKLIVVPRETPLSTIQLENMQRLSQAGAVVLPAAPGWYHGVTRIADLVDFVVARICDQLEVDHALIRRWGS